jgi:hypothetical protein
VVKNFVNFVHVSVVIPSLLFLFVSTGRAALTAPAPIPQDIGIQILASGIQLRQKEAGPQE